MTLDSGTLDSSAMPSTRSGSGGHCGVATIGSFPKTNQLYIVGRNPPNCCAISCRSYSSVSFSGGIPRVFCKAAMGSGMNTVRFPAFLRTVGREQEFAFSFVRADHCHCGWWRHWRFRDRGGLGFGRRWFGAKHNWFVIGVKVDHGLTRVRVITSVRWRRRSFSFARVIFFFGARLWEVGRRVLLLRLARRFID